MACYLFSRFGFSAYVRKKERAAEKLMRELDDMIEEPAQAELVAEAPKIDLPDEEVIKEEKQRAAGRQRTQ